MMSGPPTQDGGARILSLLVRTLASLDATWPQPWRLTHALRQLAGAEGAALTLEYASQNRTVMCATDHVSAGLESLQEILGEGSGYDAARTDQIVTGSGPEAEPRWPLLARAISERFGPLSVYSIPVHADGQLRAVATLYTRPPNTSLSQSSQNVQFVADAIGAALLVDVGEQLDLEILTGPWNSRTAVHQASGMIMAQVHCTADDALALLRAHAYALDIDIDAMAAQVVDRLVDFAHVDEQ